MCAPCPRLGGEGVEIIFDFTHLLAENSYMEGASAIGAG
jgi:hypothetical protein